MENHGSIKIFVPKVLEELSISTYVKDFPDDANFLLDLHETLITAAGISNLVQIKRRLNDSGKRLKLCNVSPEQRALFKIVRLLDLDFYETRADAIASFQANGIEEAVDRSSGDSACTGNLEG